MVKALGLAQLEVKPRLVDHGFSFHEFSFHGFSVPMESGTGFVEDQCQGNQCHQDEG